MEANDPFFARLYSETNEVVNHDVSGSRNGGRSSTRVDDSASGRTGAGENIESSSISEEHSGNSHAAVGWGTRTVVEVALEALSVKYPGREREIRQLLDVLYIQQPSSDCIYVTGPSSTGKSSVLYSLFQTISIPHAFMDCSEAISQSLFFNSLLRKLRNTIAKEVELVGLEGSSEEEEEKEEEEEEEVENRIKVKNGFDGGDAALPAPSSPSVPSRKRKRENLEHITKASGSGRVHSGKMGRGRGKARGRGTKVRDARPNTGLHLEMSRAYSDSALASGTTCSGIVDFLQKLGRIIARRKKRRDDVLTRRRKKYNRNLTCSRDKKIGEFLCLETPIAIVLDDVDRLVHLSPTLLATMLRLGQFVQQEAEGNIVVILVSKLSWGKFTTLQSDLAIPRPKHVSFPCYKDPQIVYRILSRCCISSGDTHGIDYAQYLRHVVSTFFPLTGQNNVSELKYLCAELWDIYRAPVVHGRIAPNDGGKLYANLKQFYTKAHSRVYTHTLTILELLEYVKREELKMSSSLSSQPTTSYSGSSSSTFSLNSDICSSSSDNGQQSSNWSAGNGNSLLRSSTMFQEQAEEEAPAIGGVRPFVLPFYTKYMLLASYLASYNPETSDTQYFSGKYEVRKRSRKKSKKVPQISAKQTGQKCKAPKAFPLGRMMAIFWSILPAIDMECGVPNCFELWSQVTVSLERGKLITRASKSDTTDFPTYKCNIDYESIEQLAQHLNFRLQDYLHQDFW